MRIQRIHTIDEKEPTDISDLKSIYMFGLDRFQKSIREIDITIGDVNGPKGGQDKICRVQLRLYPRGVLVAKSTGASVMQAARIACDKVKEALARTLSKRRENRSSRKIKEEREYGT